MPGPGVESPGAAVSCGLVAIPERVPSLASTSPPGIVCCGPTGAQVYVNPVPLDTACCTHAVANSSCVPLEALVDKRALYGFPTYASGSAVVVIASAWS